MKRKFRSRFDAPCIQLELSDKYDMTAELLERAPRRKICVSLAYPETFGDLAPICGFDTLTYGYGNDVDGYWKIESIHEAHPRPCRSFWGPLTYSIGRRISVQRLDAMLWELLPFFSG